MFGLAVARGGSGQAEYPFIPNPNLPYAATESAILGAASSTKIPPSADRGIRANDVESGFASE